MKRHFSSMIIASTVLVGSVSIPVTTNEVSAAAVQQKQIVLKEKTLVNGQEKMIEFIVLNKKKLYSATTLAHFFSAKATYDQKTKSYIFTKENGKQRISIILKADSNIAVTNNKKVTLSVPTKLVGKSVYVDPKPFIQALGGDLFIGKNLFISTNGLIKFETAKLNINGELSKVDKMKWNGKELYSVRDLAKAFSLSIKLDQNNQVILSKKNQNVTFKLDQNTIIKNGKSIKGNTLPINVNGTIYADLKDLVTAFDGDLLTLSSGIFVSTQGLLGGDTYNPQWINSSTLMVTNETETDSSTYLISTKAKNILKKLGIAEITVSPNGERAVFSDESGFVSLIDLSTYKVNVLNEEDDAAKFEFVWSPDGTKIFFIHGDKSDKISSINIHDGSISKVYQDSFAYKSDLRLSPDGKKLLYSVGKEGTTKYSDDKNTDVDGIDLTDTEAQLYVLPLEDSEIKPIQITNSKDNKVFPSFLKNGNIIFTSYDIEGNKLPILYQVDSKNQSTSLVSNKDIISSVVTAQGKIMILTAESNGMFMISEVDVASKKLIEIAQTKLVLTSFSVSNDGKSIAVTTPGENGEKIMVLSNGSFEPLTK
ncbi:stalk domain-containing protein [Bacillus sp. S/N-304-OC-R1]|uniref:stalk domain-containing protein n=1 Tax=Bacillus sp. S/N-304-OC-R1 TaxID=2758034 RepID=UPI001C8DCC64|nr:stalk domain-containing protein [Bacillus sp. S/N-304-OC-R1]MBY0122885.1 PD40 domain-containing protein [Bacillus sp. S/N-304-OC-R1]